MTSRTRKNASRKEVRRSIQEFARQMSPAPEPTPAPSFLSTFFTPDAETARRWAMVKAAAR